VKSVDKLLAARRRRTLRLDDVAVSAVAREGPPVSLAARLAPGRDSPIIGIWSSGSGRPSNSCRCFDRRRASASSARASSASAPPAASTQASGEGAKEGRRGADAPTAAGLAGCSGSGATAVAATAVAAVIGGPAGVAVQTGAARFVPNVAATAAGEVVRCSG
jgi:hypothetical protein